ncbi:hypothetical protein CHCC20441_0566 [Bacillus licheniformis]|nr:hypothetical protein B4092_3283 [Bacillus licheniformis]TWJ34929.1 hypothetical protein CHCC5026_3616 [Bacillus licheniformis]TWK02937.1 hypothetical protein CHCC20441_0566 [Bacillus licheniformis]TWK70607.1 hypothetical protein CHCC20339_3708 [Bacillus licheniformis]TWL67538.1 hypothetical protein CHCC15318_0280 [Bacillus licheniformis]
MSGQMIMIRYMLTARVYVLIFIPSYVKGSHSKTGRLV